MEKLIYLVFSDLHLNDWKHFNNNHSRLKVQLGILDRVLFLSDKNKTPALFAGDFLHNPAFITQYVLEGIANVFNKWKDTNAEIIWISGNHDTTERYNEDSANWVKTLSIIYPQLCTYIDNSMVKSRGNKISGVPFYRDIDTFVDKVKEAKGNILMIHQELPGASDNNGFKVNSVDGMPRKLKAMFGGFDLVICGHIHKKQELGNNVLFPGAPLQMRSSDSKGEFGYYKVYDDLTYKFVKLKSPIFRFYNTEDEITNEYDYWIKVKELKIVQDYDDYEEIETGDRNSIAKSYLKSEKVKDKRKKKLLLKYL